MSVSILIASNLDERFDWLKHRLKFLYALGHQGETLVGIWGGQDKISELQAFCSTLTPQIQVIAQGSDERSTGRLLALAEKSTGEFIVVQGDDDFLLPAAFQRPVDLLRRDSSVFCAQGRCIALELKDLGNGPFFINWFPLWQALEDKVLDKFCGFMKNACTTWHAIYRRTQYIERMRCMDEAMQHTMSSAFFESMGELYSVIKGKFVILDDVYFVKGIHMQAGSQTQRHNLSDKMPPYIILSAGFSDSFAYVQRIVKDLLANAGVNTENSEEEIMDALMDYVGVMIFKRRRQPEQIEFNFRNILFQQPIHPDVADLMRQIIATRP